MCRSARSRPESSRVRVADARDRQTVSHGARRGTPSVSRPGWTWSCPVRLALATTSTESSRSADERVGPARCLRTTGRLHPPGRPEPPMTPRPAGHTGRPPAGHPRDLPPPPPGGWHAHAGAAPAAGCVLAGLLDDALREGASVRHPSGRSSCSEWAAVSSPGSPPRRRGSSCSGCGCSPTTSGRAYETWIWPFLGFLLLPSTTIAYSIAVERVRWLPGLGSRDRGRRRGDRRRADLRGPQVADDAGA